MARFTNTLGAAALALGSLAVPALAQTPATPAPAASAPATTAKPMTTPAKPMATTTGTAKPMTAAKPMMRHPMHYAARHHGMGNAHQARSALAGHDQAVPAQDAGTARLNDQALAAAKGGAPMSASAPMSGSTMSGGTMPAGGAPMRSGMMPAGPGGGMTHQPAVNSGASVSTNH